MKTLADILGDSLEQRLNKPKPRSGFFDLESKHTCKHPEHEPPKHIHIPQGKGYKHICPCCGKEQIIIPQQTSL